MKFTAVLFDEGDTVLITGGDFKGSSGTVVGWSHVSGRAGSSPDVDHIIKLAKPVTKTVSKETDVGGGKKIVETEEVSFETAEVPASALAPSSGDAL